MYAIRSYYATPGTGTPVAPAHSVADAPASEEPDLPTLLKQGGFLTRDPRVVERKKYGKP